MKEGQKLIWITRCVLLLPLFFLSGCSVKEAKEERIDFVIPPECRNYLLDDLFGECPEWEELRKRWNR